MPKPRATSFALISACATLLFANSIKNSILMKGAIAHGLISGQYSVIQKFKKGLFFVHLLYKNQNKMRVTIDVKDSKAGFLVELLKRLKYVKIKDDKDWADDLDIFQKRFIEQGLDDLKNKRVSSYADVKAKALKLISGKK